MSAFLTGDDTFFYYDGKKYPRVFHPMPEGTDNLLLVARSDAGGQNYIINVSLTGDTVNGVTHTDQGALFDAIFSIVSDGADSLPTPTNPDYYKGRSVGRPTFKRVKTNSIGTSWRRFPTAASILVNIQNFSGVDVQIRFFDGVTNEIVSIVDQSFKTVPLLANANEIECRRIDMNDAQAEIEIEIYNWRTVA